LKPLRNYLHISAPRSTSAKWDIEEHKLMVLPIAADVDAFKPGYNPEPLRKSLGLTTEPVVMWVGGFYPWHDLSLLLESFALIVQRCPDARLVLVGDGPIRSSVADRVSKDGLRDAVIMTGPVAHSKVPELLSIADVAVVPSVRSSQPRRPGTPSSF
jgi:glycosyltransferase involved in cell wall biosynthesis